MRFQFGRFSVSSSGPSPGEGRTELWRPGVGARRERGNRVVSNCPKDSRHIAPPCEKLEGVSLVRNLFLAAGTACLLHSTATAQTPALPTGNVNNFNGWAMYFGDHPIKESRWGVHLEGQWRRNNGFNRWAQLLLRPGVNFTVNPKLMLTAGYAFINTWPYGAAPAITRPIHEHRIWEQALIRYKTGNVGWSTRLRFENRFLGVRDLVTGEIQEHRYENRFRAWQRITVPLTSKHYFAAYDEIFFFVPPYISESAFDQNRAYVAYGRRFGPNWEFEAGYLNQLIRQRNGRVTELNHTIMISIISRQPFGKKCNGGSSPTC